MDNTSNTNLVPEGFDFKMINLIDLTKGYIANTVSMATKSVTEGYYDSIKALVYAKKGQELFTQLEKAIRPIAEDQQKLSKGEVYSLHNADVSTRESGVKYDFSGCDDIEYNSLKELHDSVSVKLKEREEFLKRVSKDLELVDTETGVSYTIHPPIRSGKVGLTISIK